MSFALLGALALAGCAHGRSDAQSLRADRDGEVAVLTARATPTDLATAALLTLIDGSQGRPALDLIQRAEMLAPRRPELVWLHLRICEQLACDAKAQIAGDLQAVDPDNGFAWLPNLERAQSSGPDAVTAAVVRIGTALRMTFYWNQLEVMMVEGLAAANPSQSLAERGLTAIGLLAAEDIPPLRAMGEACRPQELDLPGRRAACAALLAHMEQSSTVLTQSYALSLEERWWRAGSPERELVRAKRRRLDYLLTVSGRDRRWRTNRDMAIRIDAARRTYREEDVELAIVKSLNLPSEPPAEWRDTLHPE